MNKITALLALTLSFVFLTACGNENQEKSDGSEFNPDENMRLENEIKRIHDDELMPKMKDIQLMMNELEERMKDNEASYTEGYEKELKAAHEGLEDSYDEMMQWMAEYSPQDHKGGEYNFPRSSTRYNLYSPPLWSWGEYSAIHCIISS